MREVAKVEGLPAAAFSVGERVRVNGFGTWYAGEVVKVGRKTITVRYTNGVGNTRDKNVNPEKQTYVPAFGWKRASRRSAGKTEYGPLVRKFNG